MVIFQKYFFPSFPDFLKIWILANENTKKLISHSVRLTHFTTWLNLIGQFLEYLLETQQWRFQWFYYEREWNTARCWCVESLLELCEKFKLAWYDWYLYINIWHYWHFIKWLCCYTTISTSSWSQIKFTNVADFDYSLFYGLFDQSLRKFESFRN